MIQINCQQMMNIHSHIWRIFSSFTPTSKTINNMDHNSEMKGIVNNTDNMPSHNPYVLSLSTYSINTSFH